MSDGWNGWSLDRDRLVLVSPTRHLDGGGGRYEVDLEYCRSSSEVLDWVYRLHQKEWVTPEIMDGFLTALNHCLCIQGNLCGGNPQPLTRRMIEAIIEENDEREAWIKANPMRRV